MLIKDFDIGIKNVVNGYVLAYVDEDDSDDYQYYVYTIKDEDSVNHIIDMLYDLLEFFGINFNSHGAHVINIIDATGMKHDPSEERTAEVLNDLQWSIPVDNIDFRCTKHPDYDGHGEPTKDCFQCKAIHYYREKNV